MAVPGSLYLSKLFLPETEEPAACGQVKTVIEKTHANAIDAAAVGASDGMRLAINVAAMLIAFLAFIALFDYLLKGMNPSWSLAAIFSWLFAPAAWLIGVEVKDVAFVADLLGTKLVANEFVAYSIYQDHALELSPRTAHFVYLCPDGFCQLRLNRHSTWRDWGDGADAAGGSCPSRRAGAIRWLYCHPGERGDCGDVDGVTAPHGAVNKDLLHSSTLCRT